MEHHHVTPSLGLPALVRLCVAAVLALLLARRGVRKGSLSTSGAIAAVFVGFATLAADYVIGTMLIAFYYSGSAFTRYKSGVKARFDLEHRSGGGQRDWTQVFATAGVPALIGVRWLMLYGLPGAYARLDFAHDAAGTMLFVACLGAFAMVAGDTWASELGVLSTRDPISVLTCRRVPRGTNGGVSAWGTLMSAAGGAFIGCVAFAVGFLEDVIEEATLDVKVHGGGSVHYSVPQAYVIPLAAAAGLVGSLLDSIIGALFQATYLEVATGKITSRIPAGASVSYSSPNGKDAPLTVGSTDVEVLHGRDWHQFYKEAQLTPGAVDDEAGSEDEGVPSPVPAAASSGDAVRKRHATPAAASKPAAARSAGEHKHLTLVRVAGWDVLTNEQTNLVSSALTAALTAWATKALLT